MIQNSSSRANYIERGHLGYSEEFGESHSLSVLEGAELRGADSKSLFSKRFNYDPKTGSTSLPDVSGHIDNWLSAL